MYWISFVISFFSFWVKPGFPFTQLNRDNIQNLEKYNFDMFYKNDCWTVICYPICVTNVSYERKIIVLSFPVISFVILISFFRYLKLNLGFLFIDSRCILDNKLDIDIDVWPLVQASCTAEVILKLLHFIASKMRHLKKGLIHVSSR